MKKSELEAYIEKGFSTRQIAKLVNVSPTTVRRKLKEHKLETVPTRWRDLKKKGPRCRCGEVDPAKFYGQKKDVCASCHGKYTKKRSREAKAFAVDFLGGKCIKCGYNKCMASLDIHHLNPKLKDPNFKSAKFWVRERFKEELKKCVLLCRNCHAEEHYKE